MVVSKIPLFTASCYIRLTVSAALVFQKLFVFFKKIIQNNSL